MAQLYGQEEVEKVREAPGDFADAPTPLGSDWQDVLGPQGGET